MKTPAILLCINLVAALQFYEKADSGDKACGLLHQAVAISGSSGRYLNVDRYCEASNQPYLGSMAACLVDSFDDEKYVEHFVSTCSGQISRDDFDRAYQNASRYLVNGTSSEGAQKAQTNPLSFDPESVLYQANDTYSYDRTNNFTLIFGIVLTAYWFAVCLIAGFFHWTKRLVPWLSDKLLGFAPFNYVRRFIVLPATFSKAHFSTKKLGPLEWLIPLRFESVLLAIYFILSAIFCGVEINNASDKPLVLQVGNRSGSLATFALPVLILFAGRNNFLQFVTGWQYTRFVVFHRWVARVSFLVLMVHVGTKTMTLKYYQAYPSSLSETYLVWGTISTVCMGCLVFFSMYWLRRTRYELFLLTHYIFAILMIAGGWIHVKIKQLEGFFIACVAVWAVNFVIRGLRLAIFGIQEATLELEADETIRVICKRPHWWRPHPGSHAFVHFLTPMSFWQSHPFTLVDEPVEEGTVGMYAKIKGGVTHGLYQQLLRAPGHSINIKVMVEGPYFEKMPVEDVERAVFIASGNGIPGMYAGAKDLAINYPRKPVRLIWVIRDYISICWFYSELKQLELLNIDIIIYVTRGSKEDELRHHIRRNSLNEKSDQSSGSTKVNGSITSINDLKQSLPFIQFVEGRPNIGGIVSDEVIQSGNHSTGFVTCGHPAMVDDIRKQVVDTLAVDPTSKIELFEQFQMW
ncbi:hypothetical protein CA3LBN_001759 [Candidozyma haemuli]|uniref:ferric-chelate reductase (NADPH) n=1 Tax=Candidozyma haemuli TaxID=45357 RepID=A0ABX8I309_9ASCO|nr:hypothetical protein CA3LBN_001759 [[Candida] haemuloni]